MEFSAAVMAKMFLSAPFFGETVFLAFVIDHGPVFVFVHRKICGLSGDVNVVRSFW